MNSGLINLSNIVENLINFLPNIISAVVIFILTLVAAGFTRRWLRKFFSLRKMTLQVNQLLTKIAYWSVIIIGLITALQQVGFNLTAFLTGVGIVGFTIGFALQDVSKNFISGILLLIHEPFSIGEAINVAGFAGTVEMIDLRATQIKTFDGQIVLVPNADIFTSAITNYSRAANRRVELKVGVAYASDMELVRKSALEAIQGIDGLLSDPAPQVLFTDFGSSTMDLSIFYWVDTRKADYFAAKAEGLLAVLKTFNAAKIEMPYPTQQILLDKQVDTDA
jgi:small conductance mechanosensitive channel